MASEHIWAFEETFGSIGGLLGLKLIGWLFLVPTFNDLRLGCVVVAFPFGSICNLGFKCIDCGCCSRLDVVCE